MSNFFKLNEEVYNWFIKKSENGVDALTNWFFGKAMSTRSILDIQYSYFDFEKDEWGDKKDARPVFLLNHSDCFAWGYAGEYKIEDKDFPFVARLFLDFGDDGLVAMDRDWETVTMI